MAETISVLIATATYVGLFRVFFDSFDDFSGKFKATLYTFPIALILDYVVNWSPSFQGLSLKVLLWLPSGLITGVVIYKFLRVAIR
jgi:hypothetical protein